MSQVEQGVPLPGLYLPNAENLARYQAALATWHALQLRAAQRIMPRSGWPPDCCTRRRPQR